MGKASRLKKARKEEQGTNANKMMNDVRKKSSLVATEKVVNGKTVVQYFNPAKRLMQMKSYSDENGQEALETMVNRYYKYLTSNGVKIGGNEE